VLARQLKKDGQLLAELLVAKELGYTLVELREKMTQEELLIWHSFFTLQREEEEKTINKSRMRR
jgi:hypothetical protein